MTTAIVRTGTLTAIVETGTLTAEITTVTAAPPAGGPGGGGSSQQHGVSLVNQIPKPQKHISLETKLHLTSNLLVEFENPVRLKSRLKALKESEFTAHSKQLKQLSTKLHIRGRASSPVGTRLDISSTFKSAPKTSLNITGTPDYTHVDLLLRLARLVELYEILNDDYYYYYN